MYGIIGKKLGHSFSANFFNKKFKDEGINNSYELFPLPTINEFPSLLEQNPDLEGLNVTIPYKQEVIKFLDSLSEEALEIGAVNVIKFTQNNGLPYLIGYNTDSIGFKESLMPLLNPEIKKALILGTGGASKAVAYVLKNLGFETTFVSRSPKEGQLGYNDLNEEIIKENRLIVNTTPLGMYPEIDSYPPIPYEYLTDKNICYDVVYNPEETEFMKRSKARGATVKNGIEMLHLQAIAAWDIWCK
ncbi:MAG: shikimate dehydrogenase [Muribaculaceae bacterium]|nr:shikimate dehydrogenase [Muribaculaceae bacterium]